MATDLGVHFWSGGIGGGGSTPDGPSHVKANKTAISSGVSTVAVTFATAFAAAPVVVAWLTCSDGSPILIETQGVPATTTGFTADLSAPTSTANYVLNWIASSVYDS